MSDRQNLIDRVVHLQLCDPLQAQKKPDWELKEMIQKYSGNEADVEDFHEPETPIVNITMDDDDDTKTVVDVSHLSEGVSDYQRMHARFKQLDVMRKQLLDEINKCQAFLKEISPELQEEQENLDEIFEGEVQEKNAQLRCVLEELNDISKNLAHVVERKKQRYFRWIGRMKQLRLSKSAIEKLTNKIRDLEHAQEVIRNQMTFTV